MTAAVVIVSAAAALAGVAAALVRAARRAAVLRAEPFGSLAGDPVELVRYVHQLRWPSPAAADADRRAVAARSLPRWLP